ncbi:hypothetical protein DSO57_1009971 [Entomophthora muscae]|uniref:Uncharacterized protein n=1 Tax=Entomophthora muscae TaxID=34485 RepID=A0ACC2US16_9FUNG|nr:hypothetical protein DSO57_1009971 [Entomophthora muscae]
MVHQHLKKTTNFLRTSLPNYVKEHFQSYEEGLAPWCSSVEASLTAQDAGMEKFLEQLKQFREHVNQQLTILEQFISTSLSAAQVSYIIMQDHWFASLKELQSYVDTQCKLLPKVPPTHPTNKTDSGLKEVWDCIQELKVTTRQQAAQEAKRLLCLLLSLRLPYSLI